MFYIVCYDISDTRRRNKVARAVDDYGNRLQYSVFEVRLDDAQRRALLKELEEIIDPDADSIYVFPLCERCRKTMSIRGRGTAFDEEIVWIA